MSCASCASHIEKKLNKLPWVSSCEVNFSTETAKIEFDADQTNYDSMNSAIEPLWYGLKSIQTAQSMNMSAEEHAEHTGLCLLYTSPSPRDRTRSRMPSSAWKKKKLKL